MGNKFGSDILIQAPDQKAAAAFYVKEFGFEITAETSSMVSIHGPEINLFIERGLSLGPVLEVTVETAKVKRGHLRAGSQAAPDLVNRTMLLTADR